MFYFVRLCYRIVSKRCLVYLIIAAICVLVFEYLIGKHSFKSQLIYEEHVATETLLRSKISKNMDTKNNFKQTYEGNNHEVTYNVHVFYYAWYANPIFDGEYRHWNHAYLPTWNKNDHNTYPRGHHNPPNDIGSNYYPTLGCYSSNDPNIIESHMKMLNDAGVGVVVLSWKPPNYVDSPYKILQTFFDIAVKYNLKVTLHVEPYEDRNPINLQVHLRSFFNKFGNHSSLYKIKKNIGTKELPVIYIYDSYLVSATAWKDMFSDTGKISIRNTEIDGIYLGLLANLQHRDDIKNSQFDGFYTYFASNGFTYGSSWKNWKSLARFAFDNKLIFIPSVGPGYIDTQVRPWNSENTRHRKHGQYYDMSWKNALNNYVQYISITSFNEWHEGTQIEPASTKVSPQFFYHDYEPEGPYFYMNLTRKWTLKFNESLSMKLK